MRVLRDARMLPRLLHRLQFDIAHAPPDAIAIAFQRDNDNKRMAFRSGGLLQRFLIDPRIAFEPIVLDGPFRIAGSVNMDVNMGRLGAMRVGARLDRAELVLAVRSNFHPPLQPRMARIALFVVMTGHVRLKNKENHALRRRLSVRLKNFA